MRSTAKGKLHKAITFLIIVDSVAVQPPVVPLGKVPSQLVRDRAGLHAHVRAAARVAEVGPLLSFGAPAKRWAL